MKELADHAKEVLIHILSNRKKLKHGQNICPSMEQLLDCCDFTVDPQDHTERLKAG